MKRWHDMPFGTTLTKQGVSFRLWAPDSASVMLCTEGAEAAGLPMREAGDGWFELFDPRATDGTRYRFEISNGLRVPDPASRFNPGDVHEASEVIDPLSFDWQDAAWQGRPWEEAVIYELHVGTFSPQGGFAGIQHRLDYLAELGVTCIELMPVADFPGARNWGYDGVLPFAPDSEYGRPEELKSLVQAAHAKGLMVLLDVVYNHFGAEGDYLWVYARKFFSQRHHTPWGDAINFDDPGCKVVREFFIHNALYWLHEYHLDGLRLDAVHAILDDSNRHFLEELAERIRASVGASRHVHLVLENDANEARFLGHGRYNAQWNDDIHHALHVIVSGEKDGYYADYAEEPLRCLGRCLAHGFAYQGELSAYRNNAMRGEPSAHLPPQSFVSFMQSHDQIGNRAFGERIHRLASDQAVRAAAAIYLLAPSVPMLFMGEEFAAKTPFQYFCDFGGELREAVTCGRRREFSRFERFADPAMQATIPDPCSEQTFLHSRLDWGSLNDKRQAEWLGWYRRLLKIRRKFVVPHLRGMTGHSGEYDLVSTHGLRVSWQLANGVMLHLMANLSDDPLAIEALPGQIFFSSASEESGSMLGPWSVVWSLDDRKGRA